MVFIDINNGDLLICDAILFYDKYMIPFETHQKFSIWNIFEEGKKKNNCWITDFTELASEAWVRAHFDQNKTQNRY